jgi:hypothetical protein
VITILYYTLRAAEAVFKKTADRIERYVIIKSVSVD